MADKDLVLIQNEDPIGNEFAEKRVNIAKGGILTADVNKAPTVLPVGVNAEVLSANSGEVTGLKWIPLSILPDTITVTSGSALSSGKGNIFRSF
jgi:hypothetical protein